MKEIILKKDEIYKLKEDSIIKAVYSENKSNLEIKDKFTLFGLKDENELNLPLEKGSEILTNEEIKLTIEESDTYEVITVELSPHNNIVNLENDTTFILATSDLTERLSLVVNSNDIDVTLCNLNLYCSTCPINFKCKKGTEQEFLIIGSDKVILIGLKIK